MVSHNIRAGDMVRIQPDATGTNHTDRNIVGVVEGVLTWDSSQGDWQIHVNWRNGTDTWEWASALENLDARVMRPSTVRPTGSSSSSSESSASSESSSSSSDSSSKSSGSSSNSSSSMSSSSSAGHVDRPPLA